MVPKFKQVVMRTGGKIAALGRDGSVWESFTDFTQKRPQWRNVDLGEMVKPVVSITAHGDRILAVDNAGMLWHQANDGQVLARGVYVWRSLTFEQPEEPAQGS